MTRVRLMFQVGIDVICHRCGRVVPACVQHDCAVPPAPDAIDQVMR